MSELLLLLGQRTRVQLLREQKRLWAVRNYSEVIRRSAQAVRLVADDRDAYVYYRVGEELGLDWDFSDPEKRATWPAGSTALPAPFAADRATLSAALHFLARAKPLQNKPEQTRSSSKLSCGSVMFGALSSTRKTFCATVLICSMPPGR